MKKILVWLLSSMLFLIGCVGLAEDTVLTIDNCEDLAEIMTAEYPYDELMTSFAEKYSGSTVAIKGFIYDPGSSSIFRNIVVCVGDYETAVTTTPQFIFQELGPETFGLTALDDFPEFIDYGQDVLMTGKIVGYDDFEGGIILDFVSLEPRNPDVEESVGSSEPSLSISCSTVSIGSESSTSWTVDGESFTLKGNETKTIETQWGTYKFDAFGNYEKLD